VVVGHTVDGMYPKGAKPNSLHGDLHPVDSRGISPSIEAGTTSSSKSGFIPPCGEVMMIMENIRDLTTLLNVILLYSVTIVETIDSIQNLNLI